MKMKTEHVVIGAIAIGGGLWLWKKRGDAAPVGALRHVPGTAYAGPRMPAARRRDMPADEQLDAWRGIWDAHRRGDATPISRMLQTPMHQVVEGYATPLTRMLGRPMHQEVEGFDAIAGAKIDAANRWEQFQLSKVRGMANPAAAARRRRTVTFSAERQRRELDDRVHRTFLRTLNRGRGRAVAQPHVMPMRHRVLPVPQFV